jgi:hypothetical protein
MARLEESAGRRKGKASRFLQKSKSGLIAILMVL